MVGRSQPRVRYKSNSPGWRVGGDVPQLSFRLIAGATFRLRLYTRRRPTTTRVPRRCSTRPASHHLRAHKEGRTILYILHHILLPTSKCYVAATG